jgi:hypothetical protein
MTKQAVCYGTTKPMETLMNTTITQKMTRRRDNRVQSTHTLSRSYTVGSTVYTVSRVRTEAQGLYKANYKLVRTRPVTAADIKVGKHEPQNRSFDITEDGLFDFAGLL